MDHLITEAAAGSQSAWYKIVEVLGPAVGGFARARGVDDSDDFVQDVFLDAARNIGSFSGSWPGFRSWVFTIAYRRLADHRRRSARRVDTVPEREGWQQADDAPDPAEQLIERETLHELLAGLDCLRPIERDVLLLRVIGELSARDVAPIVGKSEGNVRVIQNRAIERIRKQIKKSVTNTEPQRLLL